MRTLKFRAWDKRSNCWEDFNDLKISKNGVVFDKDYDWEEEVWYDKADEEHNFVIEQYTGVKDKNGKEIYEGDILEFGIAGAENRGVVGYEEDFGSYETYTSKGYIIARCLLVGEKLSATSTKIQSCLEVKNENEKSKTINKI